MERSAYDTAMTSTVPMTLSSSSSLSDQQCVPPLICFRVPLVEQSAGLLQCYQKELALKQRVLQELAHTGPQDLCMVYLSCWLHQPYIPADSRLALEALLLETGHRAL